MLLLEWRCASSLFRAFCCCCGGCSHHGATGTTMSSNVTQLAHRSQLARAGDGHAILCSTMRDGGQKAFCPPSRMAYYG